MAGFSRADFMLFIFSILLPLLLISFLGYALTRWNVLGSTWFDGVNLLTSKVLVPSLLFLGMFTTYWQLIDNLSVGFPFNLLMVHRNRDHSTDYFLGVKRFLCIASNLL
jgi:hypothetical protein